MDDRRPVVGVEDSYLDEIPGVIGSEEQRHVVVLVIDSDPIA
jgi:hypothetical protein